MNYSMVELHRRLESFKELEMDWDSYGAWPPTPEALEESKAYLEFIEEYGEDLFSSFFFAPCNDGGVEFELEVDWDGGRKGFMFSLGGDEAEDFYLYEETSPGDRVFNVCWDWEAVWSQVEGEESSDRMKTILEWLIKKSHTCLPNSSGPRKSNTVQEQTQEDV